VIWTFYSFKGGAGRSMAVANIAEYLYRQGLRVVMVDWDLEAPGLESFFFRAADELKPIRSQLGLMDILLAYKRQFPLLSIPPKEAHTKEIRRVLRAELSPLSGIVYPIHAPEPAAGSSGAGLWIITAGWRGGERFPEYVEAVQSFDWSDFYLSFHGEAFFEWMREQLLDKMAADVVLIDSRTGATEMGGVCTRQLADVVVAFCVPNLQNLTDTYTLTESFLKDEVIAARGRPLQVVVVPSRIENSEIDARNRFRKEFRALLDRFIPPPLQRVDRGFWDLKIPYIPKYAYLENLAVGASDSAEELETAYMTLAMHLALLAPEESELRRVAAPILVSKEAVPALWNVPFHRNPSFAGREQLIARIRASLTAEDAAPATVAITGLGGVGKTQLAVEYAYRFRSDYDVVWWIQAESPASCAASYADLAGVLSLPGHDSAEESVIVEAVQKWLGHNARWLLVFDNAQGPGDIGLYLPRGGFGDVLITSRSPKWRRHATIAMLDVFSAEEAAEFISVRTGQRDPSAAAELAEALGELPLALEQAAAYIDTTGLSLVDYQRLFQEHEARILQRGEVLGYAGSVATTWKVSFQRVQEVSPAAADLLNLFAFLAPDEIPLDAIVDGATALPPRLARALTDPLELNETMAVLRDHSLVRVGQDAESVSVHRLVQAVTREELEPAASRALATAALRLMQRVFPSDGRDPEQWPACARLVPHALAAAGHAQDLKVQPAATSSLLDDVGVYLHARGELDAARSALERAQALGRDAYGPRDERLVEIGTNLGLLQLQAGSPQEASATAAAALELARELNDPGIGPLTVLGAAVLATGDTRQAIELQEQAVSIARDSLGENHPGTLTATSNLAEALRVKGDLALARSLQEQVLEGRRAILGPDHPDTLAALAALAATVLGSGDLALARSLQEQVLEGRRAILGPDHPDTLAAFRGLAEMLRAQGDPDAAAALEEQAANREPHAPEAGPPPSRR
jgi:tetratricopeptide (TPR) repeat protein